MENSKMKDHVFMKSWIHIVAIALIGQICLLPAASAALTATLREGSNKWGYAGRFHTATIPWNGSDFTATVRLKLPKNAKGEALLPRNSWAGLFIQDSKNKHRYLPVLVSREAGAVAKTLTPAVIAYKKQGNIQWRIGEPKKIAVAESDEFELETSWSHGELRFRVKSGNGSFQLIGSWKTPADFHPDTIGISLDAYDPEPAPGPVDFLRLSIAGAPRKYDFDFTVPKSDWTALRCGSEKGEWLFPAVLEAEWLPDDRFGYVFDNGAVPVVALRIHTTELIGKKIPFTWQLTEVHASASTTPIASGRQVVTLTRRLTEVRPELPRLTRNNVYRLEVNLEGPDGGETLRRTMQFAVIPAPLASAGQPDPASPYIISNTRNYALFARIGFRKLRGCFFNYAAIGKTIDELQRHGMLYIGTMNGNAGGKNIQQLSRNTQYQVKEILRLKKEKPTEFLFSEFYNEPENWSPTPVQTQLWPFAMQVAEIFRDVHAAGTGLQLINPGVSHRNLSFLYQLAVASMGKPDRMPDIIAVHGYRSPQMPEFAHEDDVAAIRALFGSRPIWNNEDAYFVEGSEGGAAPTITAPSASAIELPEMTQAAYLVRVMLNQLAAGYSAVSHFDGIRNHSMFRDFWHVRPAAVTVAALTRFLPRPELEKTLTEATDNLRSLQWRSDGETVITVWTLKTPERVTVTGDSEIYDGFGNRVAGQSFVCGELPHYIKGKQLKFTRGKANGTLPALPLESEKPPLSLGVAVVAAGGTSPDGKPEVRVRLHNPGASVVTGEISPVFMNQAPADWKFRPASARYELAPGETRTLTFQPNGAKFRPDQPDENAGYTALWWCEGYRIGLRQSADGKERFLPQRRFLSFRSIPYLSEYQIDGLEKEWADVPVFRTGGTRKRNLALADFWGGPTDYNADFQLAWCAEGLLLHALVTDDRHDATETGLNAWRTDSIQLGVTGRYEDPVLTDYPVLTLATSGAVLQRDNTLRRKGAVPEVRLATVRREPSYEHPGTTRYECLIPWSLIPDAVSPVAGKTLGFQILFNESDGYWRKGWVGWFSPMGGHVVDPRTFGDITLIGPGRKK